MPWGKMQTNGSWEKKIDFQVTRHLLKSTTEKKYLGSFRGVYSVVGSFVTKL